MEFIVGFLSVLIAFGYGAAIYAFRASRREVGAATWWFLAGFSVLAGAIVLRGLYWDVAIPLLHEIAPLASNWWEDRVGRMANVVFLSMKVFAFYCALKCRQMLIPEHERHKWPWYLAWLHPAKVPSLKWRY